MYQLQLLSRSLGKGIGKAIYGIPDEEEEETAHKSEGSPKSED